jgi:outer membrane receptor protein involved in Fe transport
VYYTEGLGAQQSSVGVPSYVRVDTGLTWRPDDHLSLSAGVQNLLQGRHAEYATSDRTFVVGTDVPRTVYVKVVYAF